MDADPPAGHPGDSPRPGSPRGALEPERSVLGWLVRPRALVARARRLIALLREVEARSLASAARLERLEEDAARGLAALREELAHGADASRERDHDLALRADAVEREMVVLQGDLERLRSEWAAALEGRVDGLEGTIRATIVELERVRDRMVPALSGRMDVLVDRLADELEEVGSLVERTVRREPLPVPAPGPGETALCSALNAVQPLLVDSFRGDEAEIRHRLERLLPRLAGRAPVLDLGCGRGELLILLREAGIAARGVESDLGRAGAARRRGLDVVVGDVLEVLRSEPDASWGAVTAIHLFEHLQPGTLLALLAEVRRVLRADGVLVAECPDPVTLRVGASLFWLDPTHRRPLLRETLELFLTASGFEVVERERLHPFPEDQRLRPQLRPTPADAAPGVAVLAAELDRVLERLDDLINGPRDFALVARAAGDGSGRPSAG